jgi:hypothetical protein
MKKPFSKVPRFKMGEPERFAIEQPNAPKALSSVTFRINMSMG